MMKYSTNSDNASFKSIAGMILPQLAILFLNLLINLTDVWVAGKISPAVQASFGMIVQINLLFYTLVMALSSGAVAVVSQSFGAERNLRATRYITLLLIFAASLSFVMMLPGYVCKAPLLRLSHVPEDIYAVTSAFYDISLLTMPAQYLFTMATAIFRAAKLVKVTLIVTIAIVLINVIGDLGFGLGYFGLPNYGAMGIAWSTFAATSVGALSLVFLLMKRGWLQAKNLPSLTWIRKAFPYVLKVAFPSLGTSIMWNFGYFIMFVIVAGLPSAPVEAMAGLTAAMRVISLITVPAMACNMSVSVLVGFSLGKNNEEEARRIVRQVLWTSVSTMCFFSVILWLFRHEVAAMMSTDVGVQRETILYLAYNLFAIPFAITGMMLDAAFSGAGATMYGFVTFCISVWGIRLPLAYALGHYTALNAEGVYLAMLISTAAKCFMVMYIYQKKPWAGYAMRAKKSTKVATPA